MTMPRIIARPDKLDLDSPGRRDYWVALEHDSIWGDHLLPLTVFVGCACATSGLARSSTADPILKMKRLI